MNLRRTLKRIHLQSPQPRALATFYANAYGMYCKESDGVWSCTQTDREVWISTGQAGKLHYALFVFSDPAHWGSFLQTTQGLPKINLQRFSELPASAVGFLDPDGNCMVFGLESTFNLKTQSAQSTPTQISVPAASSQHFALRTMQIEAMMHFYTDALGFVLSDKVHDESGQLKACFVRGNEMHHVVALFGAPVNCFDHQSFETPTWNALKDWADHMGQQRIEIVWGVGRHGPGNDVFFMVRDPDGNLAEISSEIEICTDQRPAGQWKHEERTLNLWGKAIMRS
jgi:catechol-2,3-dioxygenase